MDYIAGPWSVAYCRKWGETEEEEQLIAKGSEAQQDQAHHNVDRYPTFRQAISKIMEEGNLPQGPIERLEVTALASGEVTYRWWAPRALEPEGGYFPTI